MGGGAGSTRATASKPWLAWWPVGGLLLLAMHLATVAVRTAPVQGDLRTYLWAARAAVNGLDPYRLEDLSRVAGRPVSLPFVYPPVALLPFMALDALPGAAPLLVWMGLKLALMLGLVLLWRRLSPPLVPTFALALVTVFGFNATSLWDLHVGNVALLESALIWAGLACYIGGRPVAFTVLIVAASIFKLAPIAFLALLLAPGAGARPRVTLLAAALLAFAAIVWGPLAVPPASHWDAELGVLSGGVPIGETNPSVFSLMLIAARAAFEEPKATIVAAAAWLALGVLLVMASARFLRAAWTSGDRRAIAMAAAFLFVLLHPRPMAYGFIPLLPASLYFAPRPFTGRAGVLALGLLLSAEGISWAFHIPPSGTLLTHAPALLGILVWALIVLRPPAASSAPPMSRG